MKVMKTWKKILAVILTNCTDLNTRLIKMFCYEEYKELTNKMLAR